MTKNRKIKGSTQKIAFCALMIALSFVLSLVKVFQAPYGGSVTAFSMLPVCLVSIKYGLGWGLGSSLAYSVTQFFVSGALGWGLDVKTFILCVLLDYIIAYTVLGFSGMFRRFGIAGEISGIAFVCFLRFVCHFLSGVVIWQSYAFDAGFSSTFLYSFVYNGTFMLPETLMTAAGAFIIIKALRARHQL